MGNSASSDRVTEISPRVEGLAKKGEDVSFMHDE